MHHSSPTGSVTIFSRNFFLIDLTEFRNSRYFWFPVFIAVKKKCSSRLTRFIKAMLRSSSLERSTLPFFIFSIFFIHLLIFFRFLSKPKHLFVGVITEHVAVYFLAASRKPDWRLISLCAITVAAGTLAKPSFAICALPAVVLCSAYQYARQAAFSKIGVLCGWLLPALVVLLWQYFRTYASSHDPARYANSIIFAPLAVMTSHTSELAAPYFWSILLPASVLVVYGKRAWADGGLRFSLTAFLFGTTYAYTLAEQYYHFTGNFLWSAYITMFIVYFFSTVFVLKQLTKPAPKFATLLRALPCLVVLTWNLAAGVSVHMNYFRLSR